MFKKVKAAMIAVTGTVVGIGLAQEPNIQSLLHSASSSVLGWVHAGPEDFLAESKDRLQQGLASFAASRAQLEAQLKTVTEQSQAREEERMQVEVLLARFKDEFAAGQQGGFPRTIFTRAYTAEQMKQQVQRLLERQAVLQAQPDAGLAQLQEALDQITARIAESTRHLENMPIYEALAVAGQAIGASDTVLAELTTCLDANQSFLTKSPVRETEDLWREAQNGSEGVMSVDEFLTPTQTSEAVANDAPSVSDLTAALRDIVNQHRHQGRP